MNKHRANATSSSLRTFERQAHFSPYLLRIYALNEYFSEYTAAGWQRPDDGRIYTETQLEHVETMLARIAEYNTHAETRKPGSEVGDSALAFMEDVRLWLAEVPHFASDSLVSYKDAIFKVYRNSAIYTRIVFNKKTVICGTPELREAGTSIVER